MQELGAALVSKDAPLYALKEAGQRMADTLNLHIVAGVTRGWCAFKLEDGRSDNTVYDTRDDAARHQANAYQCWFEALRPASFSADECALTLAFARNAYDAGWRHGEGDPAPIKPVRIEDFIGKARQLGRRARRR